MLKNINPLFIIASLLIITSCSKDDPEHSHDRELIDKITLTITNQAGGDPQIIIWEDDDHANEGDHDHDHDHGDDDNHVDEGEHVEIDLAPNSTYDVEVKFENTKNPDGVENITLEVIEEADEHHVLYELVELSNFTIVSAEDDYKDSEQNALNIKTVWTTGAAESGDIRLYLIHEPTSKTGTTRADFGDGPNDAEADYEIHIE
jgi:hypothetical protein